MACSPVHRLQAVLDLLDDHDLKQDFLITETVDIPYHGYVLDDYVMQKDLTL